MEAGILARIEALERVDRQTGESVRRLWEAVNDEREKTARIDVTLQSIERGQQALSAEVKGALKALEEEKDESKSDRRWRIAAVLAVAGSIIGPVVGWALVTLTGG